MNDTTTFTADQLRHVVFFALSTFATCRTASFFVAFQSCCNDILLFKLLHLQMNA